MSRKVKAPAINLATKQHPGWVVVHEAARDNYELPIALAEAGALECFVTDWYTPLNQPFWQRFAMTKLGRSAHGISRRYRSELPSGTIADNKLNFIAGLVRRKFSSGLALEDLIGGWPGRRAASLANRHGCHLLAASYSAAGAFESLRPGIKRVLFQVHPHPRFLRSLYLSQMEKDSDYAGLANEPEVLVSEQDLARWEQESKLADHILCASNFTRRSLEWSGIPEEKISVIPYGVNSATFKPGKTSGAGPLKVLFVGQKVARKGLRMLLRVWQQLQPQNARLLLAGGHIRHESVIQGFEHLFTETPRTGAGDIIRLFQEADIFVLPSLAEGFGHVYLEALACGLPVICTDNTGAADIIVHGESGWVLPAGNPVALSECLSWAFAHPQRVRQMREAARAVAERHTWERFRGEIREVLLSDRGVDSQAAPFSVAGCEQAATVEGIA